jgi:polyhydroxyalkanoate synthesis regulator protein
MQGPTIQGMMASYLEHSATTFLDMQQQLQKQARSIFGNFPFGNFPGGDKAEEAAAPEEGYKQPQKKTGS